MNLSLNSAAESLIRQIISTGQFETPESVVETALFKTFPSGSVPPNVGTRHMDPPTSFDDGVVIELPRNPGVPVKAIPATKPRLPDIILPPGIE